jgi:hypothetical protein
MLVVVNSIHVVKGYLMNFYSPFTFDDVMDISCPSVGIHAEICYMSFFCA